MSSIGEDKAKPSSKRRRTAKPFSKRLAVWWMKANLRRDKKLAGRVRSLVSLIIKSQEQTLPLCMTPKKVADLAILAFHQDGRGIKAKLKEIVPEYQPFFYGK